MDTNIFSFQNLEVYKKSLDFITNIYCVVKKYPNDEIYNLVSQIKRAATSISLNIAEGSGRYNNKEKAQFYKIANASIYEVVAALEISYRLKFINEEVYFDIVNKSKSLSQMLNKLIKATLERQQP